MHYVFTPVGSGGDVRPFLAVAQRMVTLGHRVTLLAAEPFAADARRAGVEFVSIWPTEDYEREVLDPDLWNPRKGMRLVIRILLENLERFWEALESVHEHDTVFVSHALAFATRAFAEKHGAPSATMHLQPNVFRTIHDQPKTLPGVDVNRIPRAMRPLFWRLIDGLLIDPIIAPQLNRWRATHGLPPIRRVFQNGIHAPDLVLALFPDWFAPRQPDWPVQARHSGFPLVRDLPDPLDPELDAWLANGDPPIVFTAGTANRQAERFFEAAVDAAERLKRRALLLTQWREQLHSDLPETIRWSRWAPLGVVLPRSAAYVHHGGIGSCADGLAAGVPQLCMTMAFDQPDNAARLERLNAGRALTPKKFDGVTVAATLRALLDDHAVAAACRRAADRLRHEDGVGNAATALAAVGTPRDSTGR